MVPAYLSGDHVLTLNWVGLRIRDVVVFRHNDKRYIKRIKKFYRNKVLVGGDNKKESTKDMYIDQDEIIGKVIFKY